MDILWFPMVLFTFDFDIFPFPRPVGSYGIHPGPGFREQRPSIQIPDKFI